MPPVMMTCVTPTAMMPITDDLQDHHDQALLVEQEALLDEDPAEQLEAEREPDEHQEDARLRAAARRQRCPAPGADACVRHFLLACSPFPQRSYERPDS